MVEYVEDIYRFYKSTEVILFLPYKKTEATMIFLLHCWVIDMTTSDHCSFAALLLLQGTCLPLSTYMSSQDEINERMRAILVDWIIEVQHRLKLMPETLYLTVYVIDQYLSMENVPRKELQLVGISAMLIACKYEEIWAPMVGFLTLILSICASKHTSSILCITYTMQQCIQIKDLLCLCDNAFSREQVLTKEKAILNKLHWNLTVPTMYMFIVRYLKAARGDKTV